MSEIQSIDKAPRPKPEPKRKVELIVMNAAHIQEKEYTEPVFVVEKVLHKGATLAMARPKFGKSWLALQLAIAVSTGRKALGRFEVPKKGRVLYMALEDTESRIHRRLAALNIGDEKFTGIDFAFNLPEKLGDSGDIRISHYLQQHKGEYSVVILDTMLAAFGSDTRQDRVQADYDKSAILRKLADDNNVALLAIHHQNKGKDPAQLMDTVNGTTGLAAGVDSTLFLTEEKGQKVLHVVSRETESADFAIKFDLGQGGWSVEGPAQEVLLCAGQRVIVALLNDAGPMKSKEIVDALGKKGNTTRTQLHRLKNTGVLRLLPNGAYWLANKSVPEGYDTKPRFCGPITEADPADVPF